MILAGDVGGTKTNLGLFRLEGGNLRADRVRSFPSHDYSSLESLIKEFIADLRGIESACFGVAGPVIHDAVRATNLPWVVDQKTLRDHLHLPQVSLINDLEANAYGISLLGPQDLLTLNEGTPEPNGHAALIAAGTGLGECSLYWNGTMRVPAASEGGHASFAPHTPLAIELLQYLAKRFGHVSWERILSGPGLLNVYEFLRDTGRGSVNQEIADRMKLGDPSAVISQAALAHECEICVQALDIFVAVYGSEAGNMALRGMATNGVYIGGGITPKIKDKLTDGVFMKAFLDKGRLSAMLAKIPVRIILNPQTALLGAARHATLQVH